jgi:ABC-type glycerol-3-phosphate transport system substrate-binding protein
MRRIIKNRTRRTAAAILAAAMVMMSFTGCGGGSNSGEGGNSESSSDKGSESADGTVKGYNNDTMELVESSDENTNISGIKCIDGNIYYQKYEFPEMPPEYYEDMKKIDAEMSDSASSTMDMNDTASSDGAADTSGDKTADGDKKGGKKDKADNTGAEVSDDELLGDVDDLFGDGKKDDKDSKDNKDSKDDASKDDTTNNGESGDNADDEPFTGEVKTYEDLTKKYADYKTVYAMYQYNIDTKENKKLFDFPEDEAVDFSEYIINKAGNFLVFSENWNYDEKTEESTGTYELKEIGMDGKKINTVNLNETLKLSGSGAAVSNAGEEDALSMVHIVDEDKIVAQKGNNLIIFNSKGELKGTVENDKYLSGYALDSDGNVVLKIMDNDDKAYYAKADLSTYKIGDKLEGIDDKAEYSPYILVDGAAPHSIYLRDSISFYSYDYDSAEKKELFKFMDLGLIGDNMQNIIPLSDGRLFYTSNDYDSGKMTPGVISEGDVKSDDSKQKITVMMMYADGEIQKNIIKYNKEDNPYKIELVTFDNEEDPQTSMNNQITAGNIPDIIDVESVDFKSFVAKNMLDDLMPYVGKDDKLNEDYFVDGFLDASKVDGKLYYLTKGFSINTLVGKASDLKKYKDGWRMKDVIEYYKSKPKGTGLFVGDTKTTAYYNLIAPDLDSYIDWNSGTVSFDSKEFRDALEFCNSFPSEDENMTSDLKKDDIKKGKILLRDSYIYNTETVQVDNKLYDGDYMYVGLPCKEGKGNYLNISRAFGICSASENKDAAWDVIKVLVAEPEEKNETYYYGDIPASKEKFEEMLKRDSITKEYTDENGEKVYPRESSYGFEDFEISIGPATKDEIETLRNLIKDTHGINESSSKVSDLVTENVMPYFDGKKSIDEVIKVLQDKMSKYINENK